MPQILHYAELNRESFSEDTTGLREYTRHFLAKVSEIDGRQIAALRRHDPSVQLFQPHPEDDEAFVHRWNPQQREDSLWFDIVVDYNNQLEPQEDPLAIPALVTWNQQSYRRPVFFEQNGEPLTNTAGQLLELEEDVGLWVATVRKNVGGLPLWFKQYKKAVNNDTVRLDGETFEPRTLYLDEATIGEEQQINDIRYRELVLKIVHDDDTWDARPLNRGTTERHILSVTDANNTTHYFPAERPILDDDGLTPVREPRFLTPDGIQFRLEARTGKILRFPAVNRRGRIAPNDAQAYLNDLAVSVVKNPLQAQDIYVLRKRIKREQPFARLPLA